MSKRWEQFQVGSLAAVIRRLYTYLLPIYTTVEQVNGLTPVSHPHIIHHERSARVN